MGEREVTLFLSYLANRRKVAASTQNQALSALLFLYAEVLNFSSNPNLKGAPSDHVVPIREVRLSAGAEFVVVICGEIMTMPGLPRVPAANSIALDADGNIVGLF